MIDPFSADRTALPAVYLGRGLQVNSDTSGRALFDALESCLPRRNARATAKPQLSPARKSI
jgi:hypothetical protein